MLEMFAPSWNHRRVARHHLGEARIEELALQSKGEKSKGKLTLESELLVDVSNLGKNTNFEAAHREEKLRVVLRVNRDESIIPLDGSERSRKTVLDVPEDCTTEIDVVFDETHSTISRPTLLVVVTDQVLVVRIGVCREVTLDEISRFFGSESEHDVNSVE